jgi:hypothetical protein
MPSLSFWLLLTKGTDTYRAKNRYLLLYYKATWVWFSGNENLPLSHSLLQRNTSSVIPVLHFGL